MSTYKEAVNEASQFHYIANIASMYPASVYRIYGGYAVVNFEKIEHVKELAKELGSIARMAYFKENKHGKWEYNGIWDGKLFTIDNWLEAYGAGFAIAKVPYTDEYTDDQNEIIARIDSCASSHEVVTLNGKYYDNIPKEMIGFSDCSYKYEIGVFVEPFDIYLQDSKEN